VHTSGQTQKETECDENLLIERAGQFPQLDGVLSKRCRKWWSVIDSAAFRPWSRSPQVGDRSSRRPEWLYFKDL
jgi:hypothetical protein